MQKLYKIQQSYSIAKEGKRVVHTVCACMYTYTYFFIT
jgi:hypothetical protein